MKEDATTTTANIPSGPDGVFRQTPYFNCTNKTFLDCINGKKPKKQWKKFLNDEELNSRVSHWRQQSYKNTNFILRNASTGAMIFSRS